MNGVVSVVNSGGSTTWRFAFGEVTVNVVTSSDDGCPVVFVDTTFEPDDVGMRVRLNDSLATGWDGEA